MGIVMYRFLFPLLALATPATAQVTHKVNEFTGKQSFEINRGPTEPAWSVDCDPECQPPVFITAVKASSRTGYNTATIRGGQELLFVDGGKVVGACDRYGCHVTQIVALVVPAFPQGGEVMLTGSAPDLVVQMDQKDYDELMEAVGRGG